MEIRDEIISKHWLDAAIEEVAVKYRTQGYEVLQEAPIGDTHADLIARKGDELIVVEFKLGDWSEERSEEVSRIRSEVIHRLGGKFNLVLVSPPKDKIIEIEGIEDILFELFANDPGDLDQLSTHTHIEEISDVTITSVNIELNKIYIQGSGIVSVDLNWGSDTDRAHEDGITISDSYPFDFSIVLDGNLKLIEVETLEVDTSSYYE
jgi:hypothetical protein